MASWEYFLVERRAWCLQATIKSWNRSKGMPRAQHLGAGVEAWGIAEKTICKVAYPFRGSLRRNDKASTSLSCFDCSADGLGEVLRTRTLGHEGRGPGSEHLATSLEFG